MRPQHKAIIDLVGGGESASSRDLLRDRQALAAAALLARRGSYQEAENTLAVLPLTGSLGPETLDLKAKICAQQGRLVEAQAAWMEAVRQSPGNASYRRSLDYVTRCLCPSRLWLLAWGLAAMLLALGALVLLVFLFWMGI